MKPGSRRSPRRSPPAVLPPGASILGSGIGVAGVAAGGGGRLAARPLPLVGRGGRLGEGDPEEVVQHVEGHPGVGGAGAVHHSPARVGSDDVCVAGVPLPGKQVSGRDH